MHTTTRRTEAIPTPNQTNNEFLQSNPVFLRGLAELLGQFESAELAGHRSGLITLLNEALVRSDPHLVLAPDTTVILTQRIAGRLARSAAVVDQTPS